MNQHNPKQHKLTALFIDELKNQLKAIDEFFDAAWLPEQIKTLKKWRNMVAFENTKKPDPTEPFYQHELSLKLINAAWHFRKHNIGRMVTGQHNEKTVIKLYIKAEKERIKDYPQNLTRKEILNPSKVIRQTFKTMKPDDYTKILGIWLYDALKKSFLEESLTKFEVIKTYENLVKLYEAMWLIRERTKG